MPELKSWRVIHEGTGDVVLAVDYDVTGRAEARFTDLAAQLTEIAAGPVPSIWESVQPPLGTERGMSGADYVKRWSAELAEHRPTVRAVLGYCAGGTFAAGVADEVARLQGSAPKLILVDPETPNDQTLRYHFHKVTGGLAAGLAADSVAEAQEAGRVITESGRPLGEMATELTDLFQRLVPVAFEAAGLDDFLAEELIETYASFLTYLVAATGVDHRPAWRHATVITSRTPHSGLNPLPEDERASLVAEEIRLDVEHVDLLRTPAVARAVAGLLA
ncbi:hypothetical protein ACWC0C_42770 [Streptomyces sp. NPDC001709]